MLLFRKYLVGQLVLFKLLTSLIQEQYLYVLTAYYRNCQHAVLPSQENSNLGVKRNRFTTPFLQETIGMLRVLSLPHFTLQALTLRLVLSAVSIVYFLSD